MKKEMTGYVRVDVEKLSSFEGVDVRRDFWTSITQRFRGKRYYDNFSVVLREIAEHSATLAKQVKGNDGYFYNVEKYIKPHFAKAKTCLEQTDEKVVVLEIPYTFLIGKLAQDYARDWQKELKECYDDGDKPKKSFLKIVEDLNDAAERLK